MMKRRDFFRRKASNAAESNTGLFWNVRLIPWLFFAFMGIGGCSNTTTHSPLRDVSGNTTIHLHAQGITERKLKSIHKALEERGFVVQPRENEFPFSESVILYAASDGVEGELDLIREVLAQNGVKARRRLAGRTNALGTHEYNPGNIGVYIASDAKRSIAQTRSRVRNIFPLTMTNAEFVSIDCEQEHLYDFYDDERLEISQLGIPVEEAAAVTLRWSDSSKGIISLSDGAEQFRYRKLESVREDPDRDGMHVVTYNLLLRPLGHYRIPYGCNYKSTFFETF